MMTSVALMVAMSSAMTGLKGPRFTNAAATVVASDEQRGTDRQVESLRVSCVFVLDGKIAFDLVLLFHHSHPQNQF